MPDDPAVTVRCGHSTTDRRGTGLELLVQRCPHFQFGCSCTAVISVPTKKRARPLTRDNATTRALVYTRMSMDRLGEGAGLARQEEACRALCLARGWEVVDLIDDTVSATKYRLADRDGWKQVIEMIERGEIDVVVAWHLDRVTRDMRDLEDLIELALDANVGLATHIGLPSAARCSLASTCRAALRSPSAAATAARMRATIRPASVVRSMSLVAWVRRPFGYRRDGVIQRDEAELIRLAYQGVLQGRALSAIARAWTTAGHLTTAPTPGPWSNVGVRLLLLAARNAGILERYREEVGLGNWEAIVDEPTYRAVARLLRQQDRHRGQGPLSHLMTGIAVCDTCKGPIRAIRSRWADEHGEYEDICTAAGRGTRASPWSGSTGRCCGEW